MLMYWEETYIVLRKSQKNELVANKETGLEVNDDKNNYKFMTVDQSAGRSHSLKVDYFPLKWCNSSYISEQHLLIKIPFRKN